MTPARRAIASRTPGWFDEDEAVALHRWARACPGPYLELGSYCGRSTVWLGAAAEAAGTLLYAVDWHQGSPEINDGPTDTLRVLMYTLREAELLDTVIPIVATTDAAARYWRTPVGFCFIDACHDEQVVADVEGWQAHVSKVLAFHDSELPHVKRAIRRARERYGWRPAEVVGRTTVLVR